jgi:hypothetical protein
MLPTDAILPLVLFTLLMLMLSLHGLMPRSVSAAPIRIQSISSADLICRNCT